MCVCGGGGGGEGEGAAVLHVLVWVGWGMSTHGPQAAGTDLDIGSFSLRIMCIHVLNLLASCCVV
jgi:hypothetical protein